MKKLISLLITLVLLSTAVSAYYYSPYASSVSEYSHISTSERISISESERASTTYKYSPSIFRAKQTYDYGRSRSFNFARDFENTIENKREVYGFNPYITGYQDYSKFAYPYYDGSQFSDYYNYRSDYPYRQSRYIPFGY